MSRSFCGRQIGTDLAIGLLGKPMRPFIVRKIGGQVRACLVPQISRAPQPDRGQSFIVAGEQITAVRTERRGTKISRVGKLPQMSAGGGIPNGETSVSDYGEVGAGGIGNYCVNLAVSDDGRYSLAGWYPPGLQIFAFRGKQDGAGRIEREVRQFSGQVNAADASLTGNVPDIDKKVMRGVVCLERQQFASGTGAKQRRVRRCYRCGLLKAW